MDKIHVPSITAQITADPTRVEATLTDRRREAITLFAELDPQQQRELAQAAWEIGLRALQNAYTQAEEAKLQDVGRALVEDVQVRLKTHLEQQESAIARVLGTYFDPNDGQVSQRLRQFADDDGVLARQLERYLGADSSVLAATLARQVGEHSALFKKLSPTDSEGVIAMLEERLATVLREEQRALQHALDPLAEDGALSRMLKSLRQELTANGQDREKQLATALKALDANDEQSLISRMLQENQSSRTQLLAAINPENTESPMAMMKRTMATMLSEHAKTQEERALAHQTRQEAFERKVLDAVTRLEERKKQDKSGTKGGGVFEDRLVAMTHDITRGGPYLVEETGSQTGKRKGCKVGDVVIGFTDVSKFAGSKIVIEAKQDSSYTVAKAIAELEVARDNRKADAGVFVLAASHAKPNFPKLARHGHSMLVQWDPEDPGSDAYLEAAITGTLILATRRSHTHDAADMDALQDVEERVRAEVNRLGKMNDANKRIMSNADVVADEIRKGKKGLERLVEQAKRTLAALDIKLVEEQEERATPIAFPTEET